MEWIAPSKTVWGELDKIRWTPRTRRSNLWTPALMQVRVQTPLTMSTRRICRPYLPTMAVISPQVFHQGLNFQKLDSNNMVELTHDNRLTCTTMVKEITQMGPSCSWGTDRERDKLGRAATRRGPPSEVHLIRLSIWVSKSECKKSEKFTTIKESRLLMEQWVTHRLPISKFKINAKTSKFHNHWQGLKSKMQPKDLPREEQET